MAVMTRDAWTDERLDDLNNRVDDGFKEMREEFRALRGEMREEFKAVRGEISGLRGELGGEISGLRGELGEEISGLRGEIATMNRSFQQLTWGLIGAILVGFLSTAAAIISQL